MIVAPFKVLLDANVLFPFSLRYTLLRTAADGFFQLYWSEQILDEATRNLVATNTITEEQAARLRTAMTDAFPEAMVTGHEDLIEAMNNHEKDRHVAAAAVKAGAEVIVVRVKPPLQGRDGVGLRHSAAGRAKALLAERAQRAGEFAAIWIARDERAEHLGAKQRHRLRMIAGADRFSHGHLLDAHHGPGSEMPERSRRGDES